MAVVAKISTITLGVSLGSRTFQATADLQDQNAGGNIIVTITQTTTGTPPVVPDSFILRYRIDNTSTDIRSVTLTPSSTSQTNTFTITDTGLDTGVNRAGTIRMRLEAIKNSGLVADQYNVNSDDTTGQVLPTGGSVTVRDQGWFRGNTSAVVKANITGYANAAYTGQYAYADTIFVRSTLSARAYSLASTVTNWVGNIASSSVADADGDSNYDASFTITNIYPVASQSVTTVANNSALTGLAFTVLTVTSQSISIDPKITFTHILQVDDGTFTTPPTANTNIIAAGQRLNSEVGFVASRAINARSEGINGLAWTAKMWDEAELIGTETTPVHTINVTSQTQGGESGWSSSFLTWDKVLPGANWKYKVVITTANAVGLEVTPLRTLVLFASDPRIILLAAGGPITNIEDHFVAGMTFRAGLTVFSTGTLKTIAIDSGTVAICRLQNAGANAGYVEFLASDGLTWTPITSSSIDIYFWPTTMTRTSSNAHIKDFTNTTNWGANDIFVIGRAVVGGVPYGDLGTAESVAGRAKHSLGLSVN